MLEVISREVNSDPYYQQNFPNDGQAGSIVIESKFTIQASTRAAAEILLLAANCLENAFQSAINDAQVGGKVFNPQNWLKSLKSVQGEMLVAGTVAGMLPSFPTGKEIMEIIRAPTSAFSNRWSAE